MYYRNNKPKPFSELYLKAKSDITPPLLILDFDHTIAHTNFDTGDTKFRPYIVEFL